MELHFTEFRIANLAVSGDENQVHRVGGGGNRAVEGVALKIFRQVVGEARNLGRQFYRLNVLSVGQGEKSSNDPASGSRPKR